MKSQNENMNYLEIARKAYGLEVEKGRWNGSRNLEEVQEHMQGELGEFSSALRKGQRINKKVKANQLLGVGEDSAFFTFYQRDIKGTAEEEAADIFLVAMVGLGRVLIDYEGVLNARKRNKPNIDGRHLNNAMRYFTQEREEDKKFWIECAEIAEQLAEIYRIDLALHVKLKMRYNELRDLT